MSRSCDWHKQKKKEKKMRDIILCSYRMLTIRMSNEYIYSSWIMKKENEFYDQLIRQEIREWKEWI
jgi:hypothetical protein